MKDLISLPSLKNQKWILVLFILLSFGASIGNQYSFDDELVTTEKNAKITKGFGGILEILTTPYSSAFNDEDKFEYRPVTQITFAIEYAIFGLKPGISHLVNLLIYASICLFLFKILNYLLKDYPSWIPFFICLFFAIHPLHSEVVLSLKNREELIVAWCGFVSFWLLIVYFQSKEKKLLLLVFLLIAVGMNSKSSFSPFIYVIPFTFYFFNILNLKKASILLVLIALTCAFALFVPRYFIEFDLSREVLFFENPLFGYSLLDRIPMAFFSFLTYIKLHLIPYPLVAYYGYSHIELKNWSSFEPYLSLFLLVFLIFLFFANYNRNKLISFGIAIFLLFLAPFQNFPFPVTGIVAERFTFSSVLGFSILIAGLIYFVCQKNVSQKVILIFISIFMVFSILQNNNRVQDWNNLLSLLEADTKNAPNSAKLQMMYGDALMVEANLKTEATERIECIDKAIIAYKRAIQIYPDYTGTISNLGIALSIKGDYKTALIYLKKGYRLGDRTPENIFNLGACYEISTDTINAIKYYKIAGLKYGFQLAKERLDLLSK